MLDTVSKLGSYIIESEEQSKEDVLLQKSKLINTKKVICVVFELKDGVVTYDRTHLEEYDSGKSRKYLYRTFSHGLYDVTPTTRVLSVGKTERRTLSWFKEYSEKYDNRLIQSLKEQIDRKSGDIFAEISRKYDELNKEERRSLIFTIKIREGEDERYVGDYTIFRRIFKEESLNKFSSKHDVESKGVAICYLCGEQKEVLGFASPFSFYTLDKIGFAPDFIREDAWKRLPICVECAISLVAGKEFLDSHLLKNFYGFRFYVIPKFIFEDGYEDVIDDIKDANKRKYTESLLCIEDDISDIMKEKGNLLDLIFMFIRPKQKDFFDIVQYIEDVPPSWIKRLYEALNKVKSLSLFHDQDIIKKILGVKKVGRLDSDLTIGGLVRPFFPSPSYDQYFIDIIGRILAQRMIDKDLLIASFIREIQDRHVNEKSWDERILCLKSFILLLFLTNLDLLKINTGRG